MKESRAPAVSATLINAGLIPVINVSQNTRIELLDRLPQDDPVIPDPPKEQLASRFAVAPTECST
jgi:hypothetical protein